jgi:putative membrane protein
MQQKPQFLAQFAGMAAISVAAVVLAQESADRLVNPDSTFAVKAAQSGLSEVDLGQLAATRASNPDVRAFGQRMVNDHAIANDGLVRIASRKAMILPDSPGERQQATYNRLSKLSGAAFDRAYMAAMVQSHRAEVAEFQSEAQHGRDPDFRAFAAKMLPVWRTHLTLAEKVWAKVGGS